MRLTAMIIYKVTQKEKKLFSFKRKNIALYRDIYISTKGT